MDIVLIRNSERSTFKRCQFSWWWSYVENMKPKTTAPALRFGTLIHKAMEIRYPKGIKRGPHPALVFGQLYEEELKTQFKLGFKDEDGNWADAATMGEAMLNAYVDEYGKDEEWKVLHSEMPFQVVIHKGKGFKFVVTGVIDGVWQNRRNKQIYINDYKTAKTISTKHLVLDDQASTYWAFGPMFMRDKGILKPDQDLQGMLYTFMRKAIPDSRPRNSDGHCLNKDGTVSKQQPSPLFHREFVFREEAECAKLRDRVLREAFEMKRLRDETDNMDQVGKSPGMFTCPMCSVKDICELHEIDSDWQEFAKRTMMAWEPYAEHEIYDGR